MIAALLAGGIVLFSDDCRTLFERGRYADAAQCFKRIRPQTYESLFMAGLCFYAAEMNDSACKYFKLAEPKRPSGFAAADFYLGECAFESGRYEDAVRHYQAFLRISDANDHLSERARVRLKNARFAMSVKTHAPITLENLGPNVNSDGEDYNAWLSADDSLLVFNSHRKGAVGGTEAGVMHTYASDFYYCRMTRNGWSMPEHPGEPINTPAHEKEFCLAPDGKTVYFGRHPRKYSSTYNCDIYVSEFYDGRWTAPVPLPSPVNLPESCDSWPSISADGQTLYFCSDRKGGYGGHDVWRAEKNKSGTWTVKNAGPNINTPRDEFDVFIHPDGKTLYFCSDGHEGMGGQDIFMSKLVSNGKWGPPVNLGPPINTAYDDMDFFLNARGDKAYINSNRQGGYGKSDLYSFTMPPTHRPEPMTFVKGKVTDVEGVPLSQVQIVAVETPGDSVYVRTFSRDGEFLFVLPHGKSFRLFFEKEGYLHKSEHLLADSGTWRTYILEKPTPGARLTLRAVFFEHDSHELLPASQMELERVVEFMKTYPGGLEIQGHTSATGKPEYNLQLSRRRAEAVKHFLISRGVDEKRLSTVGFGETKPIASNDTYAGRALNRRIEIVLK